MINSDDLLKLFNLSPTPSLVLLTDVPKFTIAAINDAFLKATNGNRDNLINRGIFEIFSGAVKIENMEAADHLRQSLFSVIVTGKPDKMRRQRFDVPIKSTGKFEARYRTPENTPVTDENNKVAYIIHTLHDVTGETNIEALINGTEDLIWSVDTNCCLLTANEAFKKMVLSVSGKTPKEGDSIFIREFGEEINETWRTYYQRAVGGEKFTVKREIFNPALQAFQYRLVTCYPMYVESGKLSGIACHSKDVTAETVSLLALEDAKNELHQIMDSSLDLICTVGEDGSFIKVSAASEKILGYKPEELVGRKTMDFVYAEDYERTVEARKNIRSGGQLVNFENIYVRKDGSLVPISWASAWDDENKITYVVARDNTEKIKKEAALKASEKKYKYLFENNPSPMLIWDFETLKITDCNSEALIKYEYSREEFLKLTIKDIVTGEQLERVASLCQKTPLNSGIVQFGIFEHSKKNKDIIKATVSGFRVNYEGKDSMIVTCNDVTEKENALQLLKDNESKLQAAQKIAKLGYWQFKLSDQSIYWSDELFNISGLSKETFELTYNSFLETLHPDDKVIFEKSQRTAFEKQDEPVSEFRIVLPDGSIKWMHIKGKLLKDKSGSPYIIEGTMQDITESKNAHEKLLISEARQRGILASQTGYVVRTDLSGNYTYCNDKYKKDFGWLYADNDILGKTSIYAVIEYDRAKISETLGTCFANPNQVFQVEVDMRGKEDASKTTLWGVVCLTDSVGQPTELQCTGIDISDRKKAEDALFHEKNLLRTLIDNLPDYIYVKDLEYRHIVNNKANVELIGAASEAETIGKTVMDYFKHDIAIKFIEDDKNVIEKEQPVFNKEELIITRNGEKKWLLTTKIPIKDNKGKIAGLIGIGRDITESKQKEQHLKLLESFIINTNDSVLITEAQIVDEPGPRIIYVNEAFTRMTGYSGSEVIGKTPRILQGPKTDRSELDKLRNALKNKQSCEITTINYKKNGEDFWINFSVSPVADENGIVTHFISVERDVTEKILAQQELNNQKKFTEDILNNLPADIAVFDSQHNYLFLNPNAIGDKHIREWLIGKNDFDYFLMKGRSNEIAIKRREIFNKALQTKSIVDFVDEHISANGETRYILRKFCPYFEDNTLKYMFGYGIDITQRKIAELALNKALEEKNIILESIGDGFFAVDDNWIVTYWNRLAEKMLFKTKAEMLGQSLFTVFAHAINSKSFSQYHFAKESKQVVHFEDYYELQEKWYGISAYPSDQGLSVYFKDITEQKLADQRIRSERNMLRTLIDALPHAIYFKDIAARKLISNKFDYKFLGAAKEEEVLGKTDLELTLQRTSQICYQHDLEILKTGDPLIDFEECFMMDNGTRPFWLLTTKMPLRNEFNEIIGIFGIGTDITEKKLDEEKLKELNAMLEKHVNQLEMSNAELEQFAYVASHDLQEPLRMITGFLSQIEKKYATILDEKGKQYIHFAVDGAKRMRQIILDLLEFSRVGRTLENIEEVDFNNLINSIIPLFQKQAEETNASINFKNLPTVKTYKSPMRQVFQNLISNALKYHKTHTPPVIIVTCKENPHHWEFQVKDNGIGINHDYFEKIFVIFQRLHNKSEFSGTGLGLAICKKIIESLGGKIWVESVEDEGSSFYFTLLKNQ